MSGNSIEGTFATVDNECSALCAQIEEMRKKMRINNELIATVEKRIEEEDRLKAAADKDIAFLLTQIDKLEKEIDQKKVDIECLKTSCQQSDDVINDLVVELELKDFETEQQQMIFEDIKQTYQSDFEKLRQSYIDEPVVNASFDTTIAPSNQLSSNEQIGNQLSSNEQIGDQFGEDVRSDGHTTVKITTDLLEDLQNRGDMRCPTISEEDVVTNTDVSTDKPNTEQVFDKEEHKQMGDNIIESFDEQIRDMDIEQKNTIEQSSERVIGEQQLSQTIDVESVASDESSRSSQQKSPSGDVFGAMFANLFRKKPTAADEDINTGFKFKLSLTDNTDSSSISSSPGDEQKQTTTTTSFKLW